LKLQHFYQAQKFAGQHPFKKGAGRNAREFQGNDLLREFQQEEQK